MKRILIAAGGCLLVCAIFCSCLTGCRVMGEHAMTFSLNSPAFANEGEIPRKHTCEGADVSPALTWSDPPEGTRSFSLIMDDPDAPGGIWVHWVMYNLPAQTRELPEDVPKVSELNDDAYQGRNDFFHNGYGGPCPPRGRPHRYYFKLYALDARLDLAPGATKPALEKAMKGHILAQTELMGRYNR